MDIELDRRRFRFRKAQWRKRALDAMHHATTLYMFKAEEHHDQKVADQTMVLKRAVWGGEQLLKQAAALDFLPRVSHDICMMIWNLTSMINTIAGETVVSVPFPLVDWDPVTTSIFWTTPTRRQHKELQKYIKEMSI